MSELKKYKVGVITVSDRSYAGTREDTGGPLLVSLLEEKGYQVIDTALVPDEVEKIKEEFIRMSDNEEIALIVSTGGTGFSKRDVTPEATIEVCEKMAPGIPELMRSYCLRITDRACLSRAQAGIRKSCLIINFPGSPKAIKENLEAIEKPIKHGLDILRGNTSDCARS